MSLLILFIALLSGKAQHPEKIYYTYNGNIGITGVFHDSVIVASSSKLVATLDYELATIHFKLDFNTFETGSESFNRYFHSKTPIIMEFKGKLGLDYIITQNHPPLDFEVEGIMTINNVEKKMWLKGRLVHYPTEGIIACNLSIRYDIDVDDFELGEKFSGFNKVLKAEAFQAVLRGEED